MNKFISAVISIVFIFLLTGVPKIFLVSPDHITVTVKPLIEAVIQYISGIFTGESFQYHLRDRTYQFWEEIGAFFLLSFQYLALAAIIAVITGLLLGSITARLRREWLKDLFGFLGTLPDFVIIILLQMMVVWVAKITGVRIAKVATTMAEPAVLLPIISLTIIPAVYLMNTLSNRTYQLMTEDFVLTAKAKGLKKGYIHLQHIFRNVIPFLKADLHKVVAVMISNLFIVEYLFNLPGVTRLMFNYGHQYPLLVNTFFAMVLLYGLIYWGLRLFIKIIERTIIHD